MCTFGRRDALDDSQLAGPEQATQPGVVSRERPIDLHRLDPRPAFDDDIARVEEARDGMEAVHEQRAPSIQHLKVVDAVDLAVADKAPTRARRAVQLCAHWTSRENSATRCSWFR